MSQKASMLCCRYSSFGPRSYSRVFFSFDWFSTRLSTIDRTGPYHMPNSHCPRCEPLPRLSRHPVCMARARQPHGVCFVWCTKLRMCCWYMRRCVASSYVGRFLCTPNGPRLTSIVTRGFKLGPQLGWADRFLLFNTIRKMMPIRKKCCRL